jgi:outer membrane receptor protein involved in Fe transport
LIHPVPSPIFSRIRPQRRLREHRSGAQFQSRGLGHTLTSQRAPRQLLGATLQWTPAPSWNTYFNALGVADRGRVSSDVRPDPPNYVLCNLALRKSWPDNLSARVRVSNLFNRQVNDPTDSPVALPDDVPEPGRTWRIELIKQF